MRELPVVEPVDCPDCYDPMPLRWKPEQWQSSGALFAYICTRPGCRGLLSAHPNGLPVGEPASQEVRTARRLCHSIFDPLWQQAPMMACYAGTPTDASKLAAIKGAARGRAYRYIAAQIGMDPVACHLGKMLDLPQLRLFYRAARAATPEIIRDWAKANPLPPKEPAEAKPRAPRKRKAA